jgi:apolipoprotein N-acyltransferase
MNRKSMAIFLLFKQHMLRMMPLLVIFMSSLLSLLGFPKFDPILFFLFPLLLLAPLHLSIEYEISL